jgi:hypothetical protein
LSQDKKAKIIEMKVVSVTPAMAEKWLKGYINVRPITWPTVESYATDMREGHWQLTHQGLLFDEAGKLQDGGHRLHAIIRSECTIPMLCTTMSGIDIRDPIDRGRTRTLAHITGRRTYEIAALNGLRQLEHGSELPYKMTLAETEETYQHHENSFEALKSKKGKIIFGSVFAGLVWAYPISPERVLAFAEQVRRGEHIGRGDPAFALRNWQERNKRARSWDVIMATLNCIRHFINDAKLNNVYIGPMGYRAITGKRRHLKILHTPNADLVPSTNFTPKRGEETE